MCRGLISFRTYRREGEGGEKGALVLPRVSRYHPCQYLISYVIQYWSGLTYRCVYAHTHLCVCVCVCACIYVRLEEVNPGVR